jgi:hypothetical protein
MITEIVLKYYAAWVFILMGAALAVTALLLLRRRSAVPMEGVEVKPIETSDREPPGPLNPRKKLSQARAAAKAASLALRREIEDRGTPATQDERLKLRRLGDLSRRMALQLKRLEEGNSSLSEQVNLPDGSRGQ